MAEKSNCRYCDSELKEVFDLGDFYPSAYVDKNYQYNLLDKEPLILSQCTSCGLIQLFHSYDLDKLYREYFYKSNANPDMVYALQDIVNEIEKLIVLNDKEIVLDIGANDGTLLSLYKNKNLIKIGIDPEISFREEALSKCDILVSEFFKENIYPIKRKARVITFVACFYDLLKIKPVIKELKKILADDGLLVVQFTDLEAMLRLSEFSNICQEHCEYYSKAILKQFFKDFDLEVFDISINNTNGSSTRFYISHPNVFEIKGSVDYYLQKEHDYFNSFNDPFESFKNKVELNRNILIYFLNKCNISHKSVMGLGSSTKFNFLAQYYNLNSYLIKCIGEISEAKIGKVTLGTNIPIVHEKEVFDANPDFIMVNIWQFRPFFEKLLKGYVDKGGAVIFPLPEPEIWNKDGVFKIKDIIGDK